MASGARPGYSASRLPSGIITASEECSSKCSRNSRTRSAASAESLVAITVDACVRQYRGHQQACARAPLRPWVLRTFYLVSGDFLTTPKW